MSVPCRQRNRMETPMTTNPDDKKPKQVLATYAATFDVMFLLNIFVLPGIMERSIRETTYSDFLKVSTANRFRRSSSTSRILSFITPSNRMAKLRSARPVPSAPTAN